MKRTLILAAGVVATAAVVVLPSVAHAAPPPDKGWITGVAGSSAEARTIPCWSEAPAAVGSTLGGWRTVGATVCFPKRSRAWHVSQPGACTVKSDVTTGFRRFGTCVMTIDMGTYVTAWAPLGAVHPEFSIVWH